MASIPRPACHGFVSSAPGWPGWRYRARCRCGWTGRAHDDRQAAQRDRDEHAALNESAD
jgi:hypothetical protein